MAAPKRGLRDHRVRRAVCDLGLDLSRHPVRHRNHAAVPHGRRTLSVGRRDHVRDCLVAGDRQIDLGKLAHVAHHRRVFAARREWRRDDFRETHRLRTGGADRGNCSVLHRASWMGDGNGAATDSNYLAGIRRWFCGSWNLVWPGFAFSFERWPKSCDWNIDSSRLNFHLVGRLALFARRKARGLALSHGRATNDLRRHRYSCWRAL